MKPPRIAIFAGTSRPRLRRKPGLTIPNIITLMRIFLVPAVVYALLEEATGWALAGFLVAGISDGVDGFIARRYAREDGRAEPAGSIFYDGWLVLAWAGATGLYLMMKL